MNEVGLRVGVALVGNEVEVMGAAARIGFAEPVHLLRQVRGVEIFALGQRLETGTRSRQILDADQDVDDRLGVETGNGRTADMMNTTDYPRPDRIVQEHLLALEARKPPRVVVDNADRLVRLIHSIEFQYRGARIRTEDLGHPKAARYQAAPRPAKGDLRAIWTSRHEEANNR